MKRRKFNTLAGMGQKSFDIKLQQSELKASLD